MGQWWNAARSAKKAGMLRQKMRASCKQIEWGVSLIYTASSPRIDSNRAMASVFRPGYMIKGAAAIARHATTSIIELLMKYGTTQSAIPQHITVTLERFFPYMK